MACEECTAELDALKAEVERLRTFGDTIRLDILWQELVAERDQALTRVEVLEKKYTELREDYDAETDGRVKARARMAELEQECRDRQGTEDSLVAWNEEQATRITTLEAALRKYGEHEEECPGSGAYYLAHRKVGPCTCGLDAALGLPSSGKGP